MCGRGDANDWQIPGSVRDDEICGLELRPEGSPVRNDLQIRQPFAGLVGGFAIKRIFWAVSFEMPVAEEVERRNFRQVENVLQLEAAFRHLKLRVMIHAEIAHGMR